MGVERKTVKEIFSRNAVCGGSIKKEGELSYLTTVVSVVEWLQELLLTIPE